MQAANFIAFDTETATAELSSLCQLGFVVVSGRQRVRQESILIRPPLNEYAVRNSCLQGIDALADATACAIAYLKMKQGIRPDQGLIKSRSGHGFFAGHERISGDLLKPDPEHCDCNHPLYNMKVVFTGVLSSLTREDAARAAKSHGADIDSGITKRTNFVIAGSGAGPAKLKKIEQFNNQGAGIRIIGEKEFLVMIKYTR